MDLHQTNFGHSLGIQDFTNSESANNMAGFQSLNFVFPDGAFGQPINGLYFNGIYLPEEIVILIFSYVPVCDILKLRLVCKKWYNISKVHALWSTIYFREYGKIPKLLPWYTFYALFGTTYFKSNLLKNNCGEEKFNHWVIISDGGNKFTVEKNPCGSDPYPLDCPDFNKATSCFATSYLSCRKVQNIPLGVTLINYIVNKYKPHIQASEWVAGRFDCGGSYSLEVKVCYASPTLKGTTQPEVHSDEANSDLESNSDYEENNELDPIDEPFLPEDSGTSAEIPGQKQLEFKYVGNEATQWRKVELLLKDYPEGVESILFDHSGIDNQFWRGHYGPKMAGGVVRLLFETMEPEPNISEESECEYD